MRHRLQPQAQLQRDRDILETGLAKHPDEHMFWQIQGQSQGLAIVSHVQIAEQKENFVYVLKTLDGENDSRQERKGI